MRLTLRGAVGPRLPGPDTRPRDRRSRQLVGGRRWGVGPGRRAQGGRPM